MSFEKNTNLIPQIIKVQYQYLKNVSSINEGSSEFHKIINFKNSLSWLDFYGSPASFKLNEPFKNTTAGGKFLQKLILKYPGEDEDNLQYFFYLIDQPLVINIIYSNSKQKLLGSFDNPVFISPDFISDSNGSFVSVVFTRENSKRAYWLEST